MTAPAWDAATSPALQWAQAEFACRAREIVARIRADNEARRERRRELGLTLEYEPIQLRWGKCLPANYRCPAESKARFEEGDM